MSSSNGPGGFRGASGANIVLNAFSAKAGEAPAGPIAEALAACRRHLRYAALFSALLNMLFIVPMLYMLQVYDRVVPTRGTMTLFFLTLVLILGLATLAALDVIRSRLLVRASARIDRHLAAPVLEACLSARGASPGVRRRSMRDYDSLRQALTGPAILALFDAPWTPVYILICFIIHPYLALLAIVGAAIMAWLAFTNERVTRGPQEEATRAATLAHTSQDQSFAVADTVAALGMRPALVGRLMAERQSSISAQLAANFEGGKLTALAKFLRLLLQSLGLGLGAWLAINLEISAGGIFAASFLIGRALSPVDQLIAHWRTLIRARSAMNGLEELFASSEVDVSVTRLPDPKGTLELDQVTLASPRHERPLVDNVSLFLKPGEVLAVVGPSGAGKSTLARLIAGATPADSGYIRFEGADRRDWGDHQLARHVGFMPQEPTLLAGTIKENIARFQTAATPEESDRLDQMAVAAAQAAGIHESILRLPGGYDYRLDIGGRGLSLGQAQRVALARALFGAPRYLVLDEPNAHFDPESDAQFAQALAGLKAKGTTMVIVAHRLTFLPIVDRLAVIRDGRLETEGPREEVLQQLSQKKAAKPRAVAKTGAAAPAAPAAPAAANAPSASATAPAPTGADAAAGNLTVRAPAVRPAAAGAPGDAAAGSGDEAHDKGKAAL